MYSACSRGFCILPSQTDYILTQITRTFYDDQATGTPTQITPKNLRGRIAAVKVFEDGQNEGAATFYDYDIHGNVEKLVQSLPELDPKTVEYSYDLLSGNVHRVTYQKGETDQFMHRYRYDADNRLEAVFTSSDGYIWDEDARYLYYAHGPMARVELGEYKVQGVDYYYTLQGWIKGVNLQGDHDAEASNSVQKYVSKDAFGYALHYYQNDYQSITGNFGWNASSTTDLFNGNIAAMSTTLKTAGEQTMLYRYDQLNRIKTAVSSQNTYQTGYSYDANGNILSLLRNDHNNNTIDNLSYSYNTTINNRLNQIRDNSGSNQGLTSSPTPFSYQYDNIGNLIEDEEKEIGEITWTVYGKVESVEKNDGTMISYKYDATGNRIYKKVNTTETHYVRDASGNLMATYENEIAKDFVIYGSSRLGVYNGNTQTGKRTLGNKKYELSNHLGNVLSVISDNKIGIDSDTDLVADIYKPYIVSESDYYPFGMQMQDRSFQNEEYLFAFQGQETNEELGTVHYKYREADIITGRFWSVDPLAPEYPHNSPFAFSENVVINAVELEGLEKLVIIWTDIFLGENRSARSRTSTSQIRIRAEIGVSVRHPIAALQIGAVERGGTNISTVVGRTARHVAEGGNMSVGPATERNAFRHVLWQATITNRFNAETAENFGNAHEGIRLGEDAVIDFDQSLVQNVDAIDDVVDFLNNQIGREIGESLGEDASQIEIARRVLLSQKENGFWTVSRGEDGTFSISRTKITQEQYEKGLEQLNTLDENGMNESDRQTLEEERTEKENREKHAAAAATAF